ncbi:MAG: hypothetical protein IRY93_01440 [Chthoniobacterales bacterium]|nr:hypothetical protein [Chthoniobacterales bacterium]
MAGILRDADLHVEIHDDHFAQDAPDEEWLMVTGQNRWVVITRDERIRYRAAARQVIRRAKVRMFVVVARGNLRIEAVAEIFLKALPRVRSIIASEKAPFIAKIWRDGTVEVIGA